MRVLIYPFNEDFEPFIKYGMFMENMEITESLSPRGWGLQDKIIAKKIANKHDIKEVQWNNIDALLLIDSEVIVLTDQEIIEVILISAQNGKKIIVNRNLNENMFLNISDLCKKENVELIDKRVKVQGEELFDRRLQRIETPVVFVSGMGEKCNKFDVQMFLKTYLNNLDYKVCVVSSRTNAELFGIHSFPEFMLQHNLDESSKIINFNHYIKELEVSEKPEIIIIGVPGGIMPVSEKHSEHFGVLAFEVFNAVKSDALLFCIHNNKYSKEYFDELQKLCQYRFHTNIDAFVISNHAYDGFSLETEGQIKYLSFTDDEVDNSISEYPENVYGKSTYEKLAESLLDTLADYADCQVM